MRLIDADAMEKTMSDLVQGDIRSYPYSDTLWDMAFRWIDNQPEVDAVEVVRCRDCKWWKSNDCKNDTHGYIPLDENDFCSRGQRREDGDGG